MESLDKDVIQNCALTNRFNYDTLPMDTFLLERAHFRYPCAATQVAERICHVGIKENNHRQRRFR